MVLNPNIVIKNLIDFISNPDKDTLKYYCNIYIKN